MAHVLFNLYTFLTVERWLERVDEAKEVGITIKYKIDKKLFRHYKRKTSKRKVTECQFADDSSLLTSTRSGPEEAVLMYK